MVKSIDATSYFETKTKDGVVFYKKADKNGEKAGTLPEGSEHDQCRIRDARTE